LFPGADSVEFAGIVAVGIRTQGIPVARGRVGSGQGADVVLLENYPSIGEEQAGIQSGNSGRIAAHGDLLPGVSRGAGRRDRKVEGVGSLPVRVGDRDRPCAGVALVVEAIEQLAGALPGGALAAEGVVERVVKGDGGAALEVAPGDGYVLGAVGRRYRTRLDAAHNGRGGRRSRDREAEGVGSLPVGVGDRDRPCAGIALVVEAIEQLAGALPGGALAAEGVVERVVKGDGGAALEVAPGDGYVLGAVGRRYRTRLDAAHNGRGGRRSRDREA